MCMKEGDNHVIRIKLDACYWSWITCGNTKIRIWEPFEGLDDFWRIQQLSDIDSEVNQTAVSNQTVTVNHLESILKVAIASTK